MTITNYSNAIVDVMLGWLKGLANWVLRLFHLAGRVGSSPLLWLSENWLKLLIFFLALGLILDGLVWLLRWRPYWVWFRKERVIVNDDRFFINADIDKASDWEGDLANNWDEHDYVVASTVIRKHEKPGNSARSGRRNAEKHSTDRSARYKGTKVQRHKPNEKDGSGKEDPGSTAKRRHEASTSSGKVWSRTDDYFSKEVIDKGRPDSFEDEVFNVASLPDDGDQGYGGRGKTKQRRHKR